MPKRRRLDADDDGGADEDVTPRKTRSALRDHSTDQAAEAETPSRRSILKNTPSKLNAFTDEEPTPTSLRKVLFSTPARPREETAEEVETTPTAARNDRSARKKSARRLQQNRFDDAQSSDDDDEDERALAEEIMEEGDPENTAGDSRDEDDADTIKIIEATTTPTQTRRPRGRPKGRKKERTPSPPPDLPAHEQYFFDNRPGGNKTSTNTLPPSLLLNHEDYFNIISAYKDRHEADIEQLRHLHHRAFDQWLFELEEGFNICLYGYGSKRRLAMDFASHLYTQSQHTPSIIIVNGYTPGLTIRDILTTFAHQILPPHEINKLPTQPSPLLELIISYLTNNPPKSPIHLFIHSLDHANLRKPSTQILLSTLAAHPCIRLTATLDTPNFPLLWDTTLTTKFRFLHHDATTFEPYRVEIDAVEEVNALLGRSGRRLGGKDGVGYVLKSLPENARTLFRILVAEQLAGADAEPAPLTGVDSDDADEASLLGASDEEAAAAGETPSKRRQKRGRPAKKAKAVKAKVVRGAAMEGVPYRTLYHKAVEEFVASSEIGFRTLLKEFHDHAMIESRRDAGGTERLSVPFGREELEGILEELV